MITCVKYDEFQRNVRKAGLTLSAFADLLNMNRVSLSNYARQEQVPAHLAVIAVLLGELSEHGIDYRAALSRVEIPAKRPRGGAIAHKFGGNPQRLLTLDGGNA
jgi:transcriptional regulator with XRE-family HTH domain